MEEKQRNHTETQTIDYASLNVKQSIYIWNSEKQNPVIMINT